MDALIDDLLKKFEVKVFTADNLDGKGYFMHVNGNKFIVVNGNLSPTERTQVISHELGHMIRDHDTIGSYQKNSIARQRIEHNANSYLVKLYSFVYVDITDREEANYVKFAESIGIKDLEMAKCILNEAYKRQSDLDIGVNNYEI